MHGQRKHQVIDWSHLTYKLLTETSYRRKDKGRDGSDKKTRKKT